MLLLSLTLAAVSAVAAPFLGRLMGRNAGWPLAAVLAGAAGVLAAASAQGTVDVAVPWLPTLGASLALRLDGLSLVFGLIVLVIGALVMAYSARYLAPGRHADFYGLMALFAFAMLVLVTANDVIVMFVAWEATTLCSFFLIGRSATGSREPAVRTLLVTAFGGLALLTAVVIMATHAGSTRLSEILAADFWVSEPAVATAVAALLATAAFTKSAQFPFHAWLPDSMVAITPVSAYLHAAAMVKAGIYLLFRFSPVVADVPTWQVLLIGAGCITAALGALGAMRRHDMKELLAYSTVSQLGFLVAMIGIGTPEALTAAVVHTVAHALFKSSLFMVVGVVDKQAGTRDMRRLDRLGSRMPVTFAAAILAAASMAGVPPLLGFVSKEAILDAFWEAPGPAVRGPALAVLIGVVAVVTFAYSARFVIGAFASRATATDAVDDPSRAPAAFVLPAAVTALAGVVLGVLPFVLDDLISGAATAAVGEEYHAHLALWHGFTPALALSIGVLGLGTAAVLARGPLDRFFENKAFPFSALTVIDAMRGSLIAFGGRVGALTQVFDPRRHLAVPVVCLVLMTAWVSVGGLDLAPRIEGSSTPFDAALLAFVAVGVICVIVAKTRMAAVVTVGVVGFAVTIWFYVLGAADVALTQLLVEILTLVVMVLLLRRLPWRFRPRPRRSVIAPAVLAVAAGVATTVAVWAFTGRRELSAAGEYFVNEGPSETGGANIVNTILVDFRALDTLGELTVLGLAGMVIIVLLRSRRALEPREPEPVIDLDIPVAEPRSNTVFLQTIARFVGPLAVALSVFALLRGHQEPGGGFIAALVAGAGLSLRYLAAPSDEQARIRLPHVALIASGVVTATAAGMLGYLNGSFLAPVYVDIASLHLTSALLFDVGVYLAVIGVILVSLNFLGSHRLGESPEDIVAENAARRSRVKEGRL